MTKADKLRIAQVAPLWTPIPPRTYGGIEMLLKLLTDELVARGHDVTLFASGDCRTDARLRAVCPMNLTDLIGQGQANMYEYYASAAMAEALEAQDEFDVIHYHVGSAWLPFAGSARTPGPFHDAHEPAYRRRVGLPPLA
jgi:glycosyltransferase involved in cell wall biosynthesis